MEKGLGLCARSEETFALWLSALKYLAWVGQLGLSLVLPPVLALWCAGWLRERFGLGAWVLAAALVLGLLASARGFLQFLKMVQKEAGDERQ